MTLNCFNIQIYVVLFHLKPTFTFYRIVARKDSDLSVNETLSPPIHALLAGTHGTENSAKRGEYITLEESGAQALSGKTIHAHFDDIGSTYRKFKWYDQSNTDRRQGFFKICPTNSEHC